MRQKRKLRAISKTNANPLEPDSPDKVTSANKKNNAVNVSGKTSKWKIAQASVVVAEEKEKEPVRPGVQFWIN